MNYYHLLVAEMNNLESTAHKAITSSLLVPPTHPAELLRSAFTDQLFNCQWLEMARANRSHMDSPSPPANPHQSQPVSSNNSGVFSSSSEDAGGFVHEQTLKRFESSSECGQIDCLLQQLRDHFHCEDQFCVRSEAGPGRRYLKTFSKKEEIVRHCKWHKKRAETLKFGFLRFSCTDDCQLEGAKDDSSTDCQFNGKQTHYHCTELDCDKVYISTSDVQMHANYHRKTNAIRMQGFLRVRNLEQCQEPACPYAQQQTTHFHCLRDGCQFTFKNKGEMEKHKVYHLKDEQLLSDGFKKFFKTDKCKFDNCRYDGKLNHIHCIRPNCTYVFHSSGQLMSHKRKHEKSDQYASNSDCDTSSVSADNSLLDLSTTRGPSIMPTAASLFSTTTPASKVTPTPAIQRTSQATGNNTTPMSNKILQITSIDGLFNRKRGRPPKNRFVEVYNANHARTSYSPQHQHHGSSSAPSALESPQAIFASFKLDKSVTGTTAVTPPVVASKEQPDGGYSRGSLRKKPKLAEKHNVAEEATLDENTKSVVGLIKSSGIFYPNMATTVNSLNAEDTQGKPPPPPPPSQTGICTKRQRDYNDVESEDEIDADEGQAVGQDRHSHGNENHIAAYPLGVGPRNTLNMGTKHLPTGNPFVPHMFPVNAAAMEHNNVALTHGLPNVGMDWLKFAYQQANPLMVFATTAAFLAASMNSTQQSLPTPPDPSTTSIEPAVLEYAKNMLLYNNFHQLSEGVPATGNNTPSGEKKVFKPNLCIS